MSSIVKEAESHFMADIYWQRAVVWLTENVGLIESDEMLDGAYSGVCKAWGRGWFAIKEVLKGKWTITYLIDDDMLAVQFKLIHG